MDFLDFELNHKKLFLKLLYECETVGGSLVFTPIISNTVQYISPYMKNKPNIQKNDIVLVYNTDDVENMSFHEYVYISLSFDIENITSKAKSTNHINLDLLEYVGELKYFRDSIYDNYELDIQSILEKCK